MFMRWKKRLLLRPPGGQALSAQLVRSERVEGRPRQRFVAYLGTVHVNWIERGFHRKLFWRGADQRLANLDLPAAERARVERALQATVPRPTAAELEADGARLREIETALAKYLPRPAGGPPGVSTSG
jgi:hypothetical protein